MHYWVVSSLYNLGALRPELMIHSPDHSGESSTCPLCGRIMGPLLWLPPRRASLVTYGIPTTDIVDCPGAGDGLIVSDRFRTMWETEGLRGLESFEPIELVPARERSLRTESPTLYFVLPRRDGTRLDDEKSNVVRSGEERCPMCGGATIARLDGLVLDPTTIAGNDVFILSNCNKTLISPRAKEAFDRWNITHYGLIRDDHFGFDWRFCDMNQRKYPLLPGRTPIFEDPATQVSAGDHAAGSRMAKSEERSAAASGTDLSEQWLRDLERQIVQAIKHHNQWTPPEFEAWLIERYQQPDVAAYFPDGLRSSQ